MVITMNSKVLVRVEGLKQYFTVKKANGKKATLYAVDGIDLVIHQGETLGIVGESGCGKSTLGKSILGLYELSGGSVIFDGENIAEIKKKDMKKFRRKTQMIFQDPSSCLNPRRRIEDIVQEPFIIHGMYNKEERKKRVYELCDMVGLAHTHLSRYPHELSGGQKQRVGIARAIALEPQLIVCDEPVSALDVSIQAQVINLLQDLQEQLGLAYLFISHNLSVIKHCCNRIGVMYLGKIVELSPADELYEEPLHPYTRALISAIPKIGESVAGASPREILSGDLPSPTKIMLGCSFHTRCPNVQEFCKTNIPKLKEYRPGRFCACHLHEGM